MLLEQLVVALVGLAVLGRLVAQVEHDGRSCSTASAAVSAAPAVLSSAAAAIASSMACSFANTTSVLSPK